MSKYQQARDARRYWQSEIGRFRGGKLVPVMCVPVEGSESGMISQNITMELDPIAGRMITQITAELIAVFVPLQAIDALKDPAADFAGMTDVLREKFLSGATVFALEDEGEISKRCGVVPIQIAGVKKVTEDVRIGHNAAVNYLRQRKYVKATTLLHSNTALTPAIIGDTILDRFNAVLDPEDRVNGFVDLQLPTMNLPVSGITRTGGTDTGGAANITPGASSVTLSKSGDTENIKFDINSSGVSSITALFDGAAGTVSLQDFYQAEKMDALVREMRRMVDENPEYGEEMVLRWAHGLSVDAGKVPFIIAERKAVFGRDIVDAMDTAGVQDEIKRSDFVVQMGFTVPVPKTELGGNIYTFAVVKPDETLGAQPHPVFTKPRTGRNFVADEMALDPVQVTIRELDANCLQAQETTPAMYTGNNELLRNYTHYGLNRHLNPTTVENKTAIWQLEIPVSVTPDNILYPETLSHYPFADQLAEVVTYTVTSAVNLATPIIFGPTPVEELAAIETGDVFNETP